MSLPMTGSRNASAAAIHPNAAMPSPPHPHPHTHPHPLGRPAPSARGRALASLTLAALGAVVLLNAVLTATDLPTTDLLLSGSAARRKLCASARRWSSSSSSSSAASPSRRLEEALCEARTPYITAEEARTLPQTSDATSFRSEPSHVALCRELISRDGMRSAGVDIIEPFGLKEDEAVCMDWRAPLLSTMEILASSLVGSVGTSLRMTYRHECGRTRADVDDRGGGDRTTVQMTFPPSSIIVDDGLLDLEAVKSLCQGCIQEFESGGWERTLSAHDRVSHHCMLYPGGSKSVVEAHTYPEGTPEDLIESQRRELAAAIPLATIMPTVQDRLRLAAVEWRRDNGVPFGRESESGAVVPVGSDSQVLSATFYMRHIPRSATSIQVLVSADCALVESCLDHAKALKAALTSSFSDSAVRIDIAASSAAMFSRMILARYLVVPPGTPVGLLPCLAKEEGTDCVAAESDDRPGTYHWFDFVRQYASNIEVARVVVDHRADAPEHVQVGGGGSGLAAGSTVTEGVVPPATVTSTYQLSREECIDLRGRSGSWDVDYGSGTSLRSGAGGAGGDATWNDALEQCSLDLLDSKEELCEVMYDLGLTRIYFVGDHLQQAMFQSFLRLNGMDDTIVLDAEGKFVKTVGCPNQGGFSFEMVYTRTDLLDNDGHQQVVFDPIAGAAMEGSYVAPPATVYPAGTQQQPVQYVNAQQPVQYVNAAPPVQYVQAVPMVQYAPYAGQCVCNPWVQQYATAPPPPPAVAPPPPPPGGGGRRRMAAHGRTVVVAGTGSTEREPLNQYVRHFDNFRHLAESTLRPDDVLIYRTTPPHHGFCGEGRRVHQAMRDEDVREFNRYAIHGMDEMRRRARSTPPKDGRRAPELHVLDVESMTKSHPDATEEGMRNLRCDDGTGRKLGRGTGSEVHDHWNHMLFSMLGDMREAERKERARQEQEQQRQSREQQPTDHIPAQGAAPPQAVAQARQAPPQAQVQQAPPQAQARQAPPQAQVHQVAPQAKVQQAQPQAELQQPQAQTQVQQATPQAQLQKPQAQAQVQQAPPQVQAGAQQQQQQQLPQAQIQTKDQPQKQHPGPQPGVSNLVQLAWQQAKHEAALAKRQEPGHRVRQRQHPGPQPGVSNLVQMAWEQAMHETALDKRQEPGHRVRQPPPPRQP